MEAVVFDSDRKRLHFVQKAIPKVTDSHQVLLKVEYAGICGTDLHIIDGAFPCKDGTFSLGHEFCGTAVEVGADVPHLRAGDRVVVDPNRSCDACISCSSGLMQHCLSGGLNSTIGIFRDGGWAQYCLVPDAQVYKLPDSISFQTAVLCEPISCISHGFDRISPIPFGLKILVTGAGIIGNLWLIMLHLQGHKRVTVSEPNAHRVQLTKNLNTGYECVTPDILTSRKNEDDAYNFDLVIDCSGSVRAIEQAFSLLAPNGKLCMFGVADPKQTIKISPYEVFKKELTIVGALINPYSFPKALAYLEALGERYINYSNLGIKVFALKDYENAIEHLRQGTIAKAMFKLT